MEISSAKWFSELEMEDYPCNNLVNQYDQIMMNSCDHYYSLDDDLNFQCFSSSGPVMDLDYHQNHEMHSKVDLVNTNNTTATAAAATTTTNNNNNSKSSSSSSSSSQIISFECSRSNIATTAATATATTLNFESSNKKYLPRNQLGQGGAKRTPQDHILAERKRREKLTQRFIALSAVIPGLKKMDKASVLGDAIKYIKNLQQRVDNLEEQTKTKTLESVVFVKRSRLSKQNDDDDRDHHDHHDQSLPEIEAKVCGNEVLIRIHCDKYRGCLTQVLGEIEKLNLLILNTNVLPFGGSTLHITVVAQMDVEFKMKLKDLVRNLRQALLIKSH